MTKICRVLIITQLFKQISKHGGSKLEPTLVLREEKMQCSKYEESV